MAAIQKEKELVDIIGSYGPYQRRLFWFIAIANIIGIWHNFGVTFLAPNMDFKCVHPQPHVVPTHGYNFTSVTNISIPADQDQCHVLVPSNESSEIDEQMMSYDKRKPCDKWEYDRSFYGETIVSAWDLVCSREWLISFAESIYMIGFMVSVFVFGQVSDRFGRYPTIAISYVITVISGLLSVASQNYLMFVICRFFLGFGRPSLTTTGFVLLYEVTGLEHRAGMVFAIQISWALGAVTLPAVAYFLRPWMWLQLAMALPFIPLVCILWMMEESPRWLKSQGKMEKLELVVAKACKQNNRSFDPNDLQSIKNQEKGQRRTILDLMKYPQIRKKMICSLYIWWLTSFVDYTFSYHTNDLGGNPYLNFFLSGFTGFPAVALAYFGMEKFGRKPALTTCMIGIIASGVVLLVSPRGLTWLDVTLSVVGRLFTSTSFRILYLYTSELFPTVVRNTAIGSTSFAARIAAVLAPFMKELGKATHYSVPNVLITVLGAIGALLMTLLPETKDCEMHDTIEEGEEESKRKKSDSEVKCGDDTKF